MTKTSLQTLFFSLLGCGHSLHIRKRTREGIEREGVGGGGQYETSFQKGIGQDGRHCSHAHVHIHPLEKRAIDTTMEEKYIYLYIYIYVCI